MGSKELNGLIDRHLQHVVNILAFKSNFQHIALKAFTVARFTFQHEVGHKLHFDPHRSFALTLFATSAFGIEREVSRSEIHLLGKRLLCHQLTYFVVSLDIRNRIRT